MTKCTSYGDDSEVSSCHYLFKCQLLKSGVGVGAVGIAAAEGLVPKTAAAAAAYLHCLSISQKLLLNPLT